MAEAIDRICSPVDAMQAILQGQSGRSTLGIDHGSQNAGNAVLITASYETIKGLEKLIMELEYIKLAGSAISTAIIYFFKTHKPKHLSVRGRSKDSGQLEIISSMMAFDIRKRHPIVVESNIKVYLGRSLPYDQFLKLLNARNPLTAINLYLSSRSCVDFDGDNFAFAKGYGSQSKRSFWTWLYAALYFFLMGFGVLSFMFTPELVDKTNPYFLFPLGLFSIMTVAFAISMLDEGIKIKTAERFIREIEKPPLNR